MSSTVKYCIEVPDGVFKTVEVLITAPKGKIVPELGLPQVLGCTAAVLYF